MRKLFTASVDYKTEYKRFLFGKKISKKYEFIGYFYDEYENVVVRCDKLSDVKEIWDYGCYKTVIERKLYLSEITEKERVTFTCLQDNLNQADFIQYCKDNLIPVEVIIK